MKNLSGNVAIVTGASSGIGAATATALASRGVHLVLAARRTERLDALADTLCRRYQIRTLAIQTDMSRRGDIEQMVETTRQHFGRIDILINNAGLGLQGDAVQLDEGQLRYLFDVNFFAAIFAVQAVTPVMAEQGGGVIVNISSILGKIAVSSLGMVGSSAGYTASKFALGAFSAAARMELAAEHIRVITVLPGVTETEFDASFLTPAGAPAHRARKRAGLLGRIAAQRVGDRIVTAIEREEREVYVSLRDRLVVMGATAMPSLWEWGLTQVRQWRLADRRRWVRHAAFALGAAAIATALLAGIVNGLRRAYSPASPSSASTSSSSGEKAISQARRVTR